MGFHITCDDYGQWRWVLEDDQTEIAVSATSYATEQECARAISMVMATTYDTSALFVPKASFDINNVSAVRSVQIPIPFGVEVKDAAGELLDLTISAIARTVARAYSPEQMPPDADALLEAIRADIRHLQGRGQYLTYQGRLRATTLDSRLRDKIETFQGTDRPRSLER